MVNQSLPVLETNREGWRQCPGRTTEWILGQGTEVSSGLCPSGLQA